MKKLLKKFLGDAGGNFGITLGLMIAPLMVMMGAAVDYTGYKRMENRVVFSAETAMLAATKEMMKYRDQDYADNNAYTKTNAQMVAKLATVFEPFFEANFAAGGYDLTEDQYTLEYIEVDNNTKVRVTMNYDTAIIGPVSETMGITDRSTIKIATEMLINLKVQPENYVIDIVMCIDATGSMQNTLNGVQAAAKTFGTDLREEIGVGTTSNKVKIRVRPIFYRDWEEGRTYNTALATYNTQLATYNTTHAAWVAAGGASANRALNASERAAITSDFNDSRWVYKYNGYYYYSGRRDPKEYQFIIYDGSYQFFRNTTELNAWMNTLTVGNGAEPVAPTAPINHGMNMYSDFIDLDPSGEAATVTALREQRSQELKTFLSSTYAFGGNDLPEAAGACLNEAVRSNWYNVQSTESRTYFNIPSTHTIIRQGDAIPDGQYTKVTPVPIVVFWSDAAINSRFDLHKQYLSSTMPQSYNSLKAVWDDPTKIFTLNQIMIRFGPQSSTGWNTVKDWNGYFYGGSLDEIENGNAVEEIGKQILEKVPDLLRVGS